MTIDRGMIYYKRNFIDLRKPAPKKEVHYMKKISNIIVLNRMRCIRAMILCAIVIVGVFTGVVTKLVAESTSLDPDEGIRSFRYFTVLSNMFMAFAATLCIPFEIDGLRNHNYHLPRWVVETLYCGVCCVTVTFAVAICILAPAQGVKMVLFYKASLYLHLICPIASIILFIFVNDDHRIPFKHSFFVLIPLIAYAFTYWLNVFAIGEENGGWRDHYYTNVYFPYWVALIGLLIIGFGLANLVRVIHNKRHKRKKAERENYYVYGEDFDCASIEEAIAKLALREKKIDRGGEVIVPRRLLIMLKKRYQSDLTVEALCKEYLTAYFKDNC